MPLACSYSFPPQQSVLHTAALRNSSFKCKSDQVTLAKTTQWPPGTSGKNPNSKAHPLRSYKEWSFSSSVGQNSQELHWPPCWSSDRSSVHPFLLLLNRPVFPQLISSPWSLSVQGHLLRTHYPCPCHSSFDHLSTLSLLHSLPSTYH